MKEAARNSNMTFAALKDDLKQVVNQFRAGQ
jgi:hypothetical protein